MSGNAKARLVLEDIRSSARFGDQFATKAKEDAHKPEWWDGWAAAMRTVDEHTTRLLQKLDEEDNQEAVSLVSNVVDLADRRRT